MARSNRPKSGYWPYQIDRCVGIGQTKQTKILVFVRPKQGYWPDRIDHNVGISQVEETDISVLARPNRQKMPWATKIERRDQNFLQTIDLGRTRLLCPWPKLVWPIPVLGRGLHLGVLKILLGELMCGLLSWEDFSKTVNECFQHCELTDCAITYTQVKCWNYMGLICLLKYDKHTWNIECYIICNRIIEGKDQRDWGILSCNHFAIFKLYLADISIDICTEAHFCQTQSRFIDEEGTTKQAR